MPNTRSADKQARQALKHKIRNQMVKGSTKTAVKKAVVALQSKDAAQTKAAYIEAVRAVAKAASKGVIPKQRAARKISRLSKLVQKTLPAALKA
jgi:small subunit ribosomal protein S20